MTNPNPNPNPISTVLDRLVAELPVPDPADLERFQSRARAWVERLSPSARRLLARSAGSDRIRRWTGDRGPGGGLVNWREVGPAPDWQDAFIQAAWRSAAGVQLDQLGELLGRSRHDDESDGAYRQRLSVASLQRGNPADWPELHQGTAAIAAPFSPWSELTSGEVAREIDEAMRNYWARPPQRPLTEQDFGADGFPISRRGVDSYYEEPRDGNRVSIDSGTVYWDDDTAMAAADFDALLADVGAARDAIRPRREDGAGRTGDG